MTVERESTTMHITRTGQGVTLIYLSFFEPFKCMNEIFLLLVNPAFDHYFRDIQHGGLKKDFIFVVDNGPQEKPSNPLVQMCLVHLLKFLKLHRITQVSFAEYHSKRNFVERVHAEENRVLSKHGPFSSHTVHKNVVIGSREHRENIENMAEDVINCIKTAQFGKKPLLCSRGVKQSDFIFDDESTMHSFLSLSEQGKENFKVKYKALPVDLLDQLHFIWGVDTNFKGEYYDDYRLVQNDLPEKTAWTDKYSTTIFSPSHDISCRRMIQPIPDMLRWISVHELHYTPWQEADVLQQGPWNEIPGLFIPSKILDLCFSVIPLPSPTIATLIAVLAWVTPDEAKKYYEKLHSQAKSTLEADQKRETWKECALYKTKTRERNLRSCAGV